MMLTWYIVIVILIYVNTEFKTLYPSSSSKDVLASFSSFLSGSTVISTPTVTQGKWKLVLWTICYNDVVDIDCYPNFLPFL